MYSYSHQPSAMQVQAYRGYMGCWVLGRIIQLYRHYGLKYTIDSLCGLKFRHAVGSLIPAVGLKFIDTAVLYSVLRPG
jgi:hypothetical protein